MCGWIGNGSLAASPVRATILLNHSRVTGAPRSVMNTYRPGSAGSTPTQKRPWQGLGVEFAHVTIELVCNMAHYTIVTVSVRPHQSQLMSSRPSSTDTG